MFHSQSALCAIFLAFLITLPAQAQQDSVAPRPIEVVEQADGSVIAEGGETINDAWSIAQRVDPGLEASRWQASADRRRSAPR